jgi:protein phosphatase
MRFKTRSEAQSAVGIADPSGSLSADDLYQACQMRETAPLYEAQLTCIRCGAVNDPDSPLCRICGAGLIIPDKRTGFRFNASAQSSIGRVRPDNEDTVGLWAVNSVVLALVADGISGAAAGEVASCMVQETAQTDLVGRPQVIEDIQGLSDSDLLQQLQLTARHANETLLECAQHEPTLRGMGSSLTLALLRGRQLLLIHIGNSRAYLIEGQQGEIRQLTRDHTLAQALVDTGAITARQAAKHPMRNTLYRALGRAGQASQADALAVELQPDDCVILCSNGLSRHVKDHEIVALAGRCANPKTIARSLIKLTIERGAEDNVSVVALVIGG